MDWAAAHWEGYSSRCSCTKRTARSRTSGENLLFLLMAPFSQELEPPQNPVRFNSRGLQDSKKFLFLGELRAINGIKTTARVADFDRRLMLFKDFNQHSRDFG